MAAECLIAFVTSSGRSSRSAAMHTRQENALVGALLLNECLGHLRAISKANVTAKMMGEPPPAPPENDDGER